MTANTDQQEDGTVGINDVGRISIIVMMVYLILLSFFLLYSFVQFMPSSTEADGSNSISQVTFIFWTFSLSDDACLLITVALAGALGSLVHVLRSFYNYVGNRELKWSWLPMYIMLPIVGANLGLVFYLIIRGGFFSSTATVQETSFFGFAALAALAGLFSEQAVLKLKIIAETMLIKPKKGKDHLDNEMHKGDEGNSTTGNEHKK